MQTHILQGFWGQQLPTLLKVGGRGEGGEGGTYISEVCHTPLFPSAFFSESSMFHLARGNSTYSKAVASVCNTRDPPRENWLSGHRWNMLWEFTSNQSCTYLFWLHVPLVTLVASEHIICNYYSIHTYVYSVVFSRNKPELLWCAHYTFKHLVKLRCSSDFRWNLQGEHYRFMNASRFNLIVSCWCDLPVVILKHWSMCWDKEEP